MRPAARSHRAALPRLRPRRFRIGRHRGRDRAEDEHRHQRGDHRRTPPTEHPIPPAPGAPEDVVGKRGQKSNDRAAASRASLAEPMSGGEIWRKMQMAPVRSTQSRRPGRPYLYWPVHRDRRRRRRAGGDADDDGRRVRAAYTSLSRRCHQAARRASRRWESGNRQHRGLRRWLRSRRRACHSVPAAPARTGSPRHHRAERWPTMRPWISTWTAFWSWRLSGSRMSSATVSTSLPSGRSLRAAIRAARSCW